MSITQKVKGQNKWLIDIRVFREGKCLRKRETFTGTRNQAKERYHELRAEMNKIQARQITLMNKSKPINTFGEMIKLYLEKKDEMSSAHLYRYEKLNAELGDIELDQIADRFEAYIRILRRFPSKHTGKIISDSTVNRLVEVVRAVMNLATDLEIINRNPITKARFPKYKETPRDVVLPQEQIENIKNVIEREAPHLKAIVNFALQVPCRRGELVNLKRANLDLINNAIRVRNGTTKNDAGCWKPIPPNMITYFRNLPKETEYLFFRYEAKSDRYLPLGDFKKSWKRCLQIAGIEDFRFHDTRHMSATALLDNGTPERIVQEIAGWKTDMLRTYYHRSGKSSFDLIRFEKPKLYTCTPAVVPENEEIEEKTAILGGE